jgi:hypothetical protein
LKSDEKSSKTIKIRTQYCSLSPNPELRKSLNVQKNLGAKDVTRSFD